MITEYVTGIDKLELTLKQRELTNPSFDELYPTVDSSKTELFLISCTNFQNVYEYKGFVLMNRHKSTQSYNMTYNLSYHGVYIGWLQLDSRNSGYGSYIGFKADNRFLYSIGCKEVIRLFLEVFDLQINNYTALEIFIDSRQNIEKHFVTLYNDKQSYRFCTQAKCINYSGSIALNQTITPKNYKPSFYIGADDTGKRIAIYNKTREIAAKGKKDYITEFHEDHLINGDGDVYRFELRLKNRYLKNKNYSIELDHLFDTDYMKTIIQGNLPKFFEFRENTNIRQARCKPIKFINFDIKTAFTVRNGLAPSNNDSRQTKSSNIDKSKISIIKKMIKVAVDEYSKDGLEIARETAIRYDLLYLFESETRYIEFIKPKVKSKEADHFTDFDFDSI
jgi:hypothetical protein